MTLSTRKTENMIHTPKDLQSKQSSGLEKLDEKKKKSMAFIFQWSITEFYELK